MTGARHLSPFLGDRMIAAKISERQVFIRELRPQDLKFELTGPQRAEAIAIARDGRRCRTSAWASTRDVRASSVGEGA